MLTNAIIAQRLQTYLEQEGISKDYIADMLDKSASSVYRLLNEQNQNIATFSMQIADVLGLPSNHFLKDEFTLPITAPQLVTFGNIAFSKDELSPEGVKGVENLIQLCNILAIYSEDQSCQN